MTDGSAPQRTYAECLREVMAAFDELAAENVANLHAPVGPITVDGPGIGMQIAPSTPPPKEPKVCKCGRGVTHGHHA